MGWTCSQAGLLQGVSYPGDWAGKWLRVKLNLLSETGNLEFPRNHNKMTRIIDEPAFETGPRTKVRTWQALHAHMECHGCTVAYSLLLVGQNKQSFQQRQDILSSLVHLPCLVLKSKISLKRPERQIREVHKSCSPFWPLKKYNAHCQWSQTGVGSMSFQHQMSSNKEGDVGDEQLETWAYCVVSMAKARILHPKTTGEDVS